MLGVHGGLDAGILSVSGFVDVVVVEFAWTLTCNPCLCTFIYPLQPPQAEYLRELMARVGSYAERDPRAF